MDKTIDTLVAAPDDHVYIAVRNRKLDGDFKKRVRVIERFDWNGHTFAVTPSEGFATYEFSVTHVESGRWVSTNWETAQVAKREALRKLEEKGMEHFLATINKCGSVMQFPDLPQDAG